MKFSKVFPPLYRRYRKIRKVIRYRYLRFRRELPPALSSVAAVDPTPWISKSSLSVAILVTGGLGDFVVVARLVRDLCKHVGNIKVHLFAPTHQTAAWIFKSIPEVEAVYSEMFFPHASPSYDCALTINQMSYYYGEHTKYEKIHAIAPKFLDALEMLNKSRPQWDVYIHHHPHLDGAMAHTAVSLGETRHTLLYSMFGLKKTGDALELELDPSVSTKIRDQFPEWITISNGFDANFPLRGNSPTKCYPAAHWNVVVTLLKEQRPTLGIVHVGSKKSERIVGVDLSLIGKTSLPQAACVIRDGLLHVDNEGGLVHVAAALNKRSAVLFGPTSVQYFSYPQNINLTSNFCGNCWWSKKTWMEACPRGYESALCMDYLAPETVASAILEALREQATASPQVDQTVNLVS